MRRRSMRRSGDVALDGAAVLSAAEPAEDAPCAAFIAAIRGLCSSIADRGSGSARRPARLSRPRRRRLSAAAATTVVPIAGVARACEPRICSARDRALAVARRALAVTGGAVAAACETIADAAVCKRRRGAGRGWIGCRRLEDAAPVRAAEEAAGADGRRGAGYPSQVGRRSQMGRSSLAGYRSEVPSAMGSAVPVGGKDAPPVPAAAALPGSLLRLPLPIT